MHEASLHEEIVKLASDLFEKSGRLGGRDLDNWLEAERIVVTRQTAAKFRNRDTCKENDFNSQGEHSKKSGTKTDSTKLKK